MAPTHAYDPPKQDWHLDDQLRADASTSWVGPGREAIIEQGLIELKASRASILTVVAIGAAIVAMVKCECGGCDSR